MHILPLGPYFLEDTKYVKVTSGSCCYFCTVVPTMSDSDEIVCLQLLSKI